MDAAPDFHPPEHKLIIKEFNIKPNASVKVEMGSYRFDHHTPEFAFYMADPDKLESSGAITFADITIRNDDQSFRLVRTFQSYSQRTHHVTVGFKSFYDSCLRLDQA